MKNFMLFDGYRLHERLLFLIVVSLVIIGPALFAQSTYYIDPDNINDPGENGSIEHPFDTYFDVPLNSNDVYLLKCGSVFYADETFQVTGNNLTFSSYGTGEKPHIISRSSQSVFEIVNVNNIMISNIEISGLCASSCISFSGSTSKNIIIERCKLHDTNWGILAVNAIEQVEISNCEIFNITFDGIYAVTKNIEITGCHISNVNLAYLIDTNPGFANGDCIHLVNSSGNINVHHNILDHSSTGNKYCFSLSGSTNTALLFENNNCTGNILNQAGCVNVGETTKLKMRYNRFSHGHCGIRSYALSAKINYNIIIDCNEGVSLGNKQSTENWICNNTFHNNRQNLIIKEAPVVIQNNIISLLDKRDRAFDFSKMENIISDYNLIFPEWPSFISIEGKQLNNLSQYQFETGNAFNSICADPMFVNVKNYNFHLKDGAPGIDSGIGIDERFDFNGSKIPSDDPPDLGCFETQSQDSLPGSDNTFDSQHIEIHRGWNIISTYIVPTSVHVDKIFSENLSNVILIKDENGKAYWPELNIKQLETIGAGKAYLIKSSQPFALEIEGKILNCSNTPCYIPRGNSMLGYPCKESVLISDLFNSKSGDVKLIRDESGRIFWPSFNIDEIEFLRAGEGYCIYMNESKCLSFSGR